MKRLLFWDGNNWGGNGGGCIGPVVPSPIPPWKRPVQNPRTNTLYGAGTIDLSYDTTYLNSTISNNDGATPPNNIPWGIVLPNGNYVRQFLTLQIPGVNIPTSPATFLVTGTFAGFSHLLFNSIGFNALLEWDGSAWQIVAASATPS
jgi:hypothetical protein